MAEWSLWHLLNSTPHLITLLARMSNFFWGVGFPFFLSSFLQCWAQCPNPLHFQHSLSCFPSNFALSEVRACFSLSKLLMMWWYCCWEIITISQGTDRMLNLTIYCYICWGTRSSSSQMPTALIIWLYYYLNREDPYSRRPSKSNCHSSVCTTHNGAQHKVYTEKM